MSKQKETNTSNLNPTDPGPYFLNVSPNQKSESGDIGYYQATLWWFTSTAFPLIAGTFGPIANLFSICALVQPWRESASDGTRVGDPSWLLALNIVSLVSAIGANLVLLFNFAKRIPYGIAQSFTIFFWYLSCILLIIPIVLVNTILLSNKPDLVLSQSYYYALIATVVYFIISTLLLFNILGAYVVHAYPPSFSSLTRAQRTLMLQTIAFSCYLALGAGIFSTIEGWDFVDALYWADYTLLTIGFGSDFPLMHTSARILLVPYAAIGITSVGLIVSSVCALVLERGKARISKRQLEKERERWGLIIVDGRRSRRDVRQLSRAEKKVKSITDLGDEKEQSKMRRKEFELMRYIEKSANRARGYFTLAFSVAVFILMWAGGAVVFWACEREATWTYPESLYFAYVAILTIGYGDFFPSTNAAKPFFVIWSLVAVPTMTVLISTLSDTVVKTIEETTVWLGRWSILPERVVVKENQNGDEDEEKGVGGGKDSFTTTTTTTTTKDNRNTTTITETAEEIVEEIRSYSELALTIRLAREICQVAKDASNPSKSSPRYEWSEWLKWLKMMEEVGESLGDHDHNHNHNHNNNEHPQSRFQRKWTWLNDHGPLFSPETEAQWVLNRLCALLEKVSEGEIGSGGGGGSGGNSNVKKRRRRVRSE